MNTDLMFSSSTDMWATPPELYAALDEAARLLNTTPEKSGGGDNEI